MALKVNVIIAIFDSPSFSTVRFFKFAFWCSAIELILLEKFSFHNNGLVCIFRISGLPHQIFHFCWEKSGKYRGFNLGGKKGIFFVVFYAFTFFKWKASCVAAFGPKLDDEKEADPPEPFEYKED